MIIEKFLLKHFKNNIGTKIMLKHKWHNIELFTYCVIQKNHAAGRWLTCLKYVWTWTVNILTWYIMYYCHPHLYWSYICGGNSTFFLQQAILLAVKELYHYFLYYLWYVYVCCRGGPCCGGAGGAGGAGASGGCSVRVRRRV